jgi:hypothetical protein
MLQVQAMHGCAVWQSGQGRGTANPVSAFTLGHYRGRVGATAGVLEA